MKNGEKVNTEIKLDFDGKSEELGGNISSLGGYYNKLWYIIDYIKNKKEKKLQPCRKELLH